MDFGVAAKIVALRQAISNLVVQTTTDPETIVSPPEVEEDLLAVLRQLSEVTATGSSISPQEALQRYHGQSCFVQFCFSKPLAFLFSASGLAEEDLLPPRCFEVAEAAVFRAVATIVEDSVEDHTVAGDIAVGAEEW